MKIFYFAFFLHHSHSLSKRTSVYADAAYAKIKNRKGVDMNGKAVGYSVGLAHNF